MTAPVPAHQRIADAIRAEIEAGHLRDGQPLPTTRELAEEWKASSLTVTRAMDLLAADGLIATKPRAGRVVTQPSQPTPGDDMDRVRSTADPITRALRASDLITEYQLRITELSAIRQAAIDSAHDDGLTITEIGQRLGLTKGRISQLRRPR
ncbi:GntR family transcriptional regulator [Nocardia blacklockiae]|uniref:GntR family transcriptional regulator n=1 Tax=Nocardia blacklockiae TaxID=480036 RepID=UPI001895E789|nr:winged helix-turn-helix domain-containing protein [Nocardia blacklockiae]MBF6171533.1 GntR family transcriptional regulator [Nocardia blacklockiae]